MAMSKATDSMRRGLEEALAYVEGTADVSRYGVHIPADIDVKGIRTRLEMTQEAFAGRLGFSINTLRHWEQSRRVPDPRLPVGHRPRPQGCPEGAGSPP
jgi:putative transcriptional regulator